MKAAVPKDAFTGLVPDNTPPPGLLPMATVTVAAEAVTVLPSASSTTTEGASTAPAAAVAGCTTKANCAAAPAAMLKVALVAERSPGEEATSV